MLKTIAALLLLTISGCGVINFTRSEQTIVRHGGREILNRSRVAQGVRIQIGPLGLETATGSEYDTSERNPDPAGFVETSAVVHWERWTLKVQSDVTNHLDSTTTISLEVRY